MAIENEDQVSVLEGGNGRATSPRTPEVAALLNAPTTAADIAKRIGAGTTIEERARLGRDVMPDIMVKQSEAQLAAARAEEAVARRGLEQQVNAEKQILEKARSAVDEVDRETKRYQEFVQPEYKASDYAANAAARLFTGLMLGGVAKMSAIGQLQAIRDMQKAEDQGLREQFTAARIKFEESEKARKDFNSNIKDRFDRLMKLLPYDRNAALAEAKIIEAGLKDGAIVAAMKAGDYAKANKLVQKYIDEGTKVEAARIAAQVKAQAAIQVARANALAKKREPVKVDADQRKEFRRIGEAKQFYDRVSSTYQDKFFGLARIPALAQLQLNLAERGTPIPDKVIESLGGKAGLTPEVINWWKSYYEYVAKIRNTLFGATLTSNEKAEFDKFTITPATTAENAKEFFKQQKQIIQSKAQLEINRARALEIPDRVSAVFMGFDTKDFARKFATEAEAKKAFDDGLLKSGDFVIIGDSTTPQEVE